MHVLAPGSFIPRTTPVQSAGGSTYSSKPFSNKISHRKRAVTRVTRLCTLPKAKRALQQPQISQQTIDPPESKAEMPHHQDPPIELRARMFRDLRRPHLDEGGRLLCQLFGAL